MNKKIQTQARHCLWMFGLAAVLLLQGCATGYQPFGAKGGYLERRIADDTYYVVFSGNGKTPKATVDRYFIYRCAELTKQKGFKYFAVLRPVPAPAQPPAVIPAPAPAPAPAPGPTGMGSGFRQAAFDAGGRDPGGFLQVRGGGGGGGGRGGGYYVYGGGGGYYVTSYIGRATIRMFNDDTLPGTIVGYPVDEVMQKVGPFIKDSLALVEIPRPSLIDPKMGVRPLPLPQTVPPPAGDGHLPAEPGKLAPPAEGGGSPATNDKAT